MTVPHFVRDIEFDVSFARETDATEGHNALGSFVADRLMTVANEVFTALSPTDDGVVRINSLELDLGTIPSSHYFAEAERRFREKLEEALRARIKALFQDSPGQPEFSSAGEAIVSRSRSEFEIVAAFLERGYLPWNIHLLSAGQLADMLRRVIASEGPSLAALLRSACDRKSVARRICAQFPAQLRDAVTSLLAGAGELPAQGDPETSLLRALALGEAVPDEIVLEQALLKGSPGPLRELWSSWLEERPDVIEIAVRRLGVRPDVRRSIARGFPDEMLIGIVGILEPGESGFIDEFVSRPEIFREAAGKQSESPPETKARLWEFTLAFLIVETGARFNRRAYVESVLRRMAAHYNLSYRGLLRSMGEALTLFEVPSAVREEMLSLVTELGEAEVRLVDAPTADESSWELIFETALLTGDAARMAGSWFDILRSRRDSVAAIVRRRGRDAAVRHTMAALPGAMLRDIAEVLEPSEIGFIEEVAARPEFFRDTAKERESPAALSQLFWEVTLSYLLVERGSRFNRRSYLRALIASRELPNAIETELLAIVSEPAGEDFELQAAASPDHDAEWIARLEQALRTGKAGPISEWWKECAFRYRSVVSATIRRVGRSVDVRRAIAHGFSIPLLCDIAEILEPAGASFIQEIPVHAAYFAAVEQPPRDGPEPVRRRVWEFSLNYLLAERGSNFNKRSYLASVVRQMAAHNNLSYEDLVQSLAASVTLTPVAGSLRREMTALLISLRGNAESAELRRLCETSAPEKTSEAVYRLASDRGLPPNELIGRILGELEALDSLTPRQRRLRRTLRAIQGAGGLAPELHTQGMADVIRSFELYSSLTDLVRKGEAVDSPRLAELLAALRIDFPWQYARFEKERETLIPAGAEMPEAELPGTETPETDIERTLIRAATLSQSERAALVRALDRLLADPREGSLALLRGLASRSHVLTELIDFLPEKHLARIMLLAAPSGWHPVFTAVAPGSMHRQKWQFLFERFVRRTSRPPEHEVVAEFTAWLEKAGHKVKPAAPKPDHDVRPARKRLSDPVHPARREIYIRNAGVVLAAPYMPRLFQVTGLIDAKQFRDPAAAERAVHLLQFMVDGGEYAPEHLLPLNKILCGIEIEQPITREIDLTQSEKDTAVSLLQAMIAHWSILGNTSVQGLRESFLEREGCLRQADNGWQLLVQTRTFDMLIDRLPWGFKTIRHPWMQATVFVDWR